VFKWGADKNCAAEQKIGKRMINGIEAEKSAIFAGGDEEIVVLSLNLEVQHRIAVDADIRAIDVLAGQKLVAGLRDGSLIEVDHSTKKVTTVMEGHSDGQTEGLEYDPVYNLVVTTGDDNMIYVWDPATRKCVGEDEVGQDNHSRAVAINPKNGNVAVATNSGEVQIRKSAKEIT